MVQVVCVWVSMYARVEYMQIRGVCVYIWSYIFVLYIYKEKKVVERVCREFLIWCFMLLLRNEYW